MAQVATPAEQAAHLAEGCDHVETRRDLEDVWREAPVGQAQVERRRTRIAGELQIGEFRHLEARRRALRDRALDQRLVAQRLLVGPMGLDDLVLERVVAFGAAREQR